MPAPEIGVVITGKSDLDKVFGQSEKQLAAFKKHLAGTHGSISKMGRVGGIDTLAKSFGNLGRESWGVFQNISRIVDPIGILTGAGTIAGLALLESKFASLGQTNINAARGLNMSVTQLTAWQGAARAGGVSADTMAQSISNLEKARSDIKFGLNNQEAASAQQLLGAGWQAKYKSDTDVLMAISGRVSKLHGPDLAKALDQAGSAFNIDPATLNLLQRGPAWVQRNLALASRHGSMTGGQANELDQLQQSIIGVTQSLEGIGTTFTSDLAPGLTKGLTELSSWMDKNRVLIVSDVKGVVTDISSYLKNVDWAGDWKKFEDAFSRVNQAVQGIGGWKVAIGGVLGILTASAVLSIATPFIALATAIAALSGSGAGSFGALGVALKAAGFSVIGGQLVNMAVSKVTGSAAAGAFAGDITTGAMFGSVVGGIPGTLMGGAAGAAYWGLTAKGGHHASPALAPDIAAQAKLDAAKYGIPADFFLAQLRAEGGGYNNVSKAGAFGPGQLMPGTAAMLGVARSINDPNYTWQANLDASARYTAGLLKHDANQRGLAAASYNWGPTAVDKWLKAGGVPGLLPPETAAYVSQIHDNGGFSDLPQLGAPGNIGFDMTPSHHAPLHSIGMDPEDRSVIELHVTAPAGAKVTARQTGGSRIIKTSTAMPGAGR